MKTQIRVCILFFFFVITLPFVLSAESDTAEKGTKNKPKTKVIESIIGAPIVFYTPETGLAYGATGNLVFRLPGTGKKSRPSLISPLVVFTTKSQMKFSLQTETYLKENDYLISTMAEYKEFPDRFYGIGNSTIEDDLENYELDQLLLAVKFQKKLSGNLYLALEYRYSNYETYDFDPEGILVKNLVTGSTGGNISGIRLHFIYDSRDNLYFPSLGKLIHFATAHYPSFLGSNFEFRSFSLDIRGYLSVFTSNVIALRFYSLFHTGDVPFIQMGQLGGEYLMRGYYQGRYRDKNMVTFQGEYRLPVSFRWGLAFFGAVGEVFPDFSGFDLKKLKYSGGVGIRYMFSSDEQMNLRFDIGFAGGEINFYFSIYEAF